MADPPHTPDRGRRLRVAQEPARPAAEPEAPTTQAAIDADAAFDPQMLAAVATATAANPGPSGPCFGLTAAQQAATLVGLQRSVGNAATLQLVAPDLERDPVPDAEDRGDYGDAAQVEVIEFEDPLVITATPPGTPPPNRQATEESPAEEVDVTGEAGGRGAAVPGETPRVPEDMAEGTQVIEFDEPLVAPASPPAARSADAGASSAAAGAAAAASPTVRDPEADSAEAARARVQREAESRAAAADASADEAVAQSETAQPDGNSGASAAEGALSEGAGVEADDGPVPFREVAAGTLTGGDAPRAGGARGGGGGGGAAAPDVAAWEASVRQSLDAVHEPDMSAVVDGPKELLEEGEKISEQYLEAAQGAPQEALDSLPDPPEKMEAPEYKEAEDPAPESTQAVEDASDKRLVDQTLPVLEESPGGHLPRIRRAPPGVRGSGPTFTVSVESTSPPEAEPTPEPEGAGADPRADLAGDAHEAVTTPPEGEPEEVGGPIVLSQDVRAEPQPLPAAEQVDMTRIIARLFVTVPGDAAEMMTAARTGAYAQGVLQQARPDFGDDDLLPGVRNDLRTELRGIAAAAGIADEQLDAAIEGRRESLEEDAGESADDVEEAGTTAEEDAQTAAAQAATSVDSALEWVQGWLDDREATAVGEHDAEVIRQKRDRWISRMRTNVAQQVANYRSAFEERQRLLVAARGAYGSAYRQAARADRDAFLREAGSDQAARQQASERAEDSTKWANRKIQAVRTNLDGLLESARRESGRFTSAVETAGFLGVTAIREWADDQLGIERSLLDRLIQAILDWVVQSRENADAWAAERRDQHVRDSVASLHLIRSLTTGELSHVELERQIQAGQISADQLVVIQTYFSAPPGQRNAIAAVAAGMKVRLSVQVLPGLMDSLRSKLRALPPRQEWPLFDDVGVAQSSGFQSYHIVSELSSAMRSGLTGLGTDEPRIFTALSGLTPEQAAAVRGRYKHETGRDLDRDLEGEMEGTELRRAQAALEGDPNLAAAATIHDAIAGAGTDEDAIMDALRGKTPAEVEEIQQAYFELTGRHLDDDLEDDMSGDDLLQSEALVDGRPDLADAIELERAMSGAGTDEEKIEAVYERVRTDVAAQARREGWDAARMEAEVEARNQRIDAAFGNQYAGRYDTEEGKSALRTAFDSELSGAEEILMNALADNDQAKADSARLEDEFYSFHTDDDAVLTGMDRSQARARLHAELDVHSELHPLRQKRAQNLPLTQDEQDRLNGAEAAIRSRTEELGRQYFEDVRRDFNQRQGFDGALRLRIAFTTSGGDRKAAYARLEHQGRIPPELEIEYAVEEGDEDKVVRVLENATEEEVQAARNRFDNAPGRSAGDFDRFIGDNLEGRQLDDAREALNPPSTLEEAVDREIARANRELDRYNSFWTGEEERILRTRRDDLIAMRDRLQEPMDEGERDLIRARMGRQVKAVDRGVDGLREGVDTGLDSIVMAIGLTIGLAALVAAIVVTAVAYASGVGAPIGVLLTIGIAAAVTSLAATMITKEAVLGDAYRTEDMKTDLAIGAIDLAVTVATAGIGAGATGSALRTGAQAGRVTLRQSAIAAAREGTKSALEAAPAAIAGVAMDDAVQNADNSLEIGTAAVAQEVAMSVAMDGAMNRVQTAAVPRVADSIRARRARRAMAAAPPRVAGDGDVGGAAEVPTIDADGGRRPPDVRRGDSADVPDPPAPDAPRRPIPPSDTADATPLRDAADTAQAEAHRRRDESGVDQAADGLTGTPEQRAALWEQFRRDNPGATPDDFRARLQEGSIPLDQAARAVDAHQAAMREELNATLTPGEAAAFAEVEIRVLSEAEFAARMGSRKGQAAMIVENGRPTVIVREGAPPSVLREEGIHLRQFADPRTRPRVLQLDETRLRNWDSLSVDEQVDLYRIKMELEIDAHQKLVAHLMDAVGAAPAGAERMDMLDRLGTAMRTLDALQNRMSEVDALSPERRADISQGRESRPDYLEQLPRLFSKEEASSPLRGAAEVIGRLDGPEAQARAAAVVSRLDDSPEVRQRVIDAADGLDPASATRFFDALSRVADSVPPADFAGLAGSLSAMTQRIDAADLDLVETLARAASSVPMDRSGRAFRNPAEAAALVQRVTDAANQADVGRLREVAPLLDMAQARQDAATFGTHALDLALADLDPGHIKTVADRVQGLLPGSGAVQNRAAYLAELSSIVRSLGTDSGSVSALVAGSAGTNNPTDAAGLLRSLVDGGVPPDVLRGMGASPRKGDGVRDFLRAADEARTAITDPTALHNALRAASLDPNGTSLLGKLRHLWNVTDGSPANRKNLQDLIQRATTDPDWRNDLGYYADQVASLVDQKSSRVVDQPAVDRWLDRLNGSISDNKPRSGRRRTWQDQVDTAVENFRHHENGHGKRPENALFEKALAEVTEGWPEESRAMLWRYRDLIRLLAGDTGDAMAPQKPALEARMRSLLTNALAGLGPHLNTGRYSKFRKHLRERALVHLFAQAGDSLPQQSAVLRKLLDAQPDSGAKGALFQWYVETRLGLDPTGTRSGPFSRRTPLGIGSDLQGMKPGRGTHKLPNGRSGDGTVHVTKDMRGDGGPPKGNYVIDNKAGEDAFGSKQADRYADQFDANGKIRDEDNFAHDGVVYIFDNRGSVPGDLEDVLRTAKLKAKRQGKNAVFYVGFFEDGRITWKSI